MRHYIHHLTATTLAIILGLVQPQQTQAQGRQLRIQQGREGFTIVHQADGQAVVIGRADQGTYGEAAANNPIFRKWMEDIDHETAASSTRLPHHTPAHPIAYTPRTYADASTDDSPLERDTPHLLTDLWGQDNPYNLLCPEIDGKRCKVGCVATALSQVIYYYHYPEHGTGSHTYIDSLGSGQTLTADFAAHTYDYTYMLDTYADIDHTQRQAQAVALLNYDTGIAVDMRYGIKESGANSIRQPIALTQYFGYDRSIRQIFRDFYSRSELHSLLVDEIIAGRPVLCSGYGIDGGGHAFVIDGYDPADGFFHINWGWSGYANGFYNIDYMTSHQPEWNLFRDRRENGANIIQSFTIGIQPLLLTEEIRESHEYAFSHIELLENEESKAVVVTHNLANVGWNSHHGTVALALCNPSDGLPVSIFHDYGREFELEELTDTSYTDTISIDINDHTIPDGTYRLMPVFCDDDGTWREARTSRGTPNYLLATVGAADFHVRQAPEATAHLRLDDFQFPDTVVRWQSPHFSMTVTNDSPAEYCGRIYIGYELTEGSVPYVVFAGVGLYLQPGQTETLDYQYSPIRNRADQMHLRAFYDIDLFTDSIVMLPVEKDVTIVSETTGMADINSTQTDTHTSTATRQAYDLAGRKISGTSTNQIIITDDGKKRSIQNVP